MYFVLRNHRLYSWAMRLNAGYRFLLTSMSIVLLWTVWSYGIYAKNNRIICQYGVDIAALQEQKEQASQTLQGYVVDQKAISELQNFINPYYAILSEKSIIQSRMIEIIRLIKKSGLRLIRCNVGKDVDKGWYIKSIIRVDALGTMLAIQQFFLFIKEAGKMIQCSCVRIDHKDDELFHVTTDMHFIVLKDKKIPST